MFARRAAGLAVAGFVAAVAGCSDRPAEPTAQTPARTTTAESKPQATPRPRATETTGAEDPPAVTRPSGSSATYLSIPSTRISRRVVAYAGTPDDVPGDRIQDTGRLASPRGPRGGVGPGQVGNFIVTGHRTEAGRPFGRLPQVRNGAHVLVTTGGLVYDYVVTETLSVSFRRPESRSAQAAPVPGRPGVKPTRAMITLSTCATPEDHAAGNFWKDALGNPEHRIDKVGILINVRPA